MTTFVVQALPRLTRHLSVLLLCVMVQSACGTTTRSEPPSAATNPAATLSPMLTARPDPTVTQPMTQQFQNPVLRADFPDPSVIFTGDQYYAYATNSAGRNIQVARSSNLITWELLPDALPALPTWAKLGGSFVWAPEVIQIGEQFVMYYTARDKTSNRQCIGVATSVHPAGQFVDSNQQPLICQSQEGGSIDASPFRDADGTLYLYWKNDGNCCGVPTYLYGQKLSPDGLSLVGEPTRLLRNEARWEGRVIEAPTMWRQNDTYFLFFSGNNYTGFEYAVGYAVCKAPLGLCTAAAYNPILKSVMNQQPLVIGPGHQALINDQAGNTWMFYHVWEVTADGRRGNRRFLWLDRVLWTDGRPRVQGPTTTVQLLDQ